MRDRNYLVNSKQCDGKHHQPFTKENNRLAESLENAPPSGDRQHVPTDQAAPELLPCPFCGEPPFRYCASGGDAAACDSCGFEFLAAAWNRRADLAAPSAHDELIDAEVVAEAMEGGAGLWRTCSGCYETCNGHPVGKYPHSAALRCDLGGGCRECGGIGAIWDTTDYADMGDCLARGLDTSAPAEVEGLTSAACDVLAERRRQITAEGWTPEHDDTYDRDELSAAAACYAHFGWVHPSTGAAPTEWPWSNDWWKPTDRRRDLVKAGALIIAEIERIDRAAARLDQRKETVE